MDLRPHKPGLNQKQYHPDAPIRLPLSLVPNHLTSHQARYELHQHEAITQVLNAFVHLQLKVVPQYRYEQMMCAQIQSDDYLADGLAIHKQLYSTNVD